jgi:DNA-binding CsgD family transcriptional regulator
VFDALSMSARPRIDNTLRGNPMARRYDAALVRVAIYHRDGLMRSLLGVVLGGEPDLDLVDVAARPPSIDQLPVGLDVIVGERPSAAAGCLLVDTEQLAMDAGDALDALLRAVRQPRYLSGSSRPPTRGSSADGLVGDVLSEREVDILRLVAAGCTAAEIGQRLGISSRTVEAHKTRAFGKLGVEGQGAAVATALDHGLVPRSVPARDRPGQP